MLNDICLDTKYIKQRKMFKQLKEIGMLKNFIEQGKNQEPRLFKEFSQKMPEYFSD